MLVNRGHWLGRLAYIKEANKQAEIYVGRTLILHIVCCMLIDYYELHNVLNCNGSIG